MPNNAHNKLGLITWGYTTILVFGVIALWHVRGQGQATPNPNPLGIQGCRRLESRARRALLVRSIAAGATINLKTTLIKT